MKKFTTLQMLSLFIGLACQTKQTDNGTADQPTTDSSSASTGLEPKSDNHDKDHPCSSTIIVSKSNSTTLSFADGFRDHHEFRIRGARERTDSDKAFCKKQEGDIQDFGSARFVRGTLQTHLCIDEASLVKIAYPNAEADTSYEAIRMYPCLRNLGTSTYYLFVFADKSTTDNVYNDRKDSPIVMVKLPKLRDRLCEIGKDHKQNDPTNPVHILSNHFICTPRCPNDGSLLFD